MKKLFILLLNLFSKLDSRRFSDRGPYINKGKIVSLRAGCSRRGISISKLVEVREKNSSKCDCKPSFAFFIDGRLFFKNTHVEECTVDTQIENDGYVFSAGISPTTKIKITSTVSDMLCDYGITNAAVRKQIENSLVKSGDTGFGAGE